VPDWLLWLLPVPTTTGLAIAWSAWTSRTRRPGTTQDRVQEHERFRAAMARPVQLPSSVQVPPRASARATQA